jgi:phospholipase/carboxylesterase
MTQLETVEKQTAENPTHSVIWLHGLGADGNDFLPIIPVLTAPDWPALRFVFPHAPVMPVTVNGGVRMRAWYDIKGMDIADKQDEAGIRASMRAVEALIEREIERGVPSEQIILAGFSQGGAIALSLGLRLARPLAGIVALSTYLPLAEALAGERSQANADTPVFWGHGSMDPVVPQVLGEQSRDVLKALGHAVEWHSYPMPHQVSGEEIADLGTWMIARLAGSDRAAKAANG